LYRGIHEEYRMAIVVIDPGHGGTREVGGSSPNNATGPTGLLEKTVTLQIALAAEAALGPSGHQVVLTRRTDDNVGIVARADVARSRSAPVFVSIHLNAPDPNGPPAQGTETWIGVGPSAISRDLAQRVQAKVRSATGYRDRGVKSGAVSGVINPQNHDAATANCLCEVSFLSRQPAEEQRLRQPNYIASLGQAFADAITEHLTHQHAPQGAMAMAQAMVEDGATARALGLVKDPRAGSRTGRKGKGAVSAAKPSKKKSTRRKIAGARAGRKRRKGR
jgi:N-acetylmuramoyl-L-alanine amidase